jgi:nicotinate-nucleotide pyrophosphorylase (carboxylating)
MLPPYLSDADLDALIAAALAEDLRPSSAEAARGDVTTEATVPPGTQATGTITAKEDGVVAGLAVAARVLDAVAARVVTDEDEAVDVAWDVADGDAVADGDRVGVLTGPARVILVAERLALNVMQRMSGIATLTRRMVDAARPHGAQILDTRKTAPGLRRLDKWAVRLGGGTNHRIGLYDLILIKDNHVAAAGGMAEALSAARRYRDDEDRPERAGLKIEVETRTLDEVRAALDAGVADVLLLDNMTTLDDDDGTVDTSMLAEALALVREHTQAGGAPVRTEASGNVTLATVPAIAATGVDAISSGALTHSVAALDLSMRFDLA